MKIYIVRLYNDDCGTEYCLINAVSEDDALAQFKHNGYTVLEDTLVEGFSSEHLHEFYDGSAVLTTY